MCLKNTNTDKLIKRIEDFQYNREKIIGTVHIGEGVYADTITLVCINEDPDWIELKKEIKELTKIKEAIEEWTKNLQERNKPI